MRTGVSPKRIATRSINVVIRHASNSVLSVMLRITSRPAVRLMPASSSSIQLCKHISCFLRKQPHGSLATGQQYNPYFFLFLRKEVIQPHLPIRLPCYDFTPVIMPAFGGSSLAVRSPTSGIHDSHGVTGGVYKTRERIHRDILIRDY